MRPIRSKAQYSDSASNPTPSGPLFFKVSPAENCVSCWQTNELGQNIATGRWGDKGGGWIACPDCAKDTCIGCAHCKETTAPGENIECRLYGVKSPWLVCEQHVRR